MKYATVTKSIIKEIKVQGYDCKEKISLFETLSKQPKIVKYVYNILNSYKTTELERNVNKLSKWFETDGNDIQQAYLDIYKITNMVKYRDFQYRLLSNAIFTNDRLYYWKKTITQRCDYCNCDKQTTLHLLWYCPMTQALWSKIETFIKNDLKIYEIEMSCKKVILNNVHQNPRNLINFIVLVAKQYIFAAKCKGTPMCYEQFMHVFVKLYEVKRYNATSKEMEKVHSVQILQNN